MAETKEQPSGCKISLAGDLGSGKSTISECLAPMLGAVRYSTGDIVRKIAGERGMTVLELNTYMETHPEIDREIDDGLARLSEDPRAMIIDSRLAWHFTKGTFKVYLSVDPAVGAARIIGANRATEQYRSVEEAEAGVRDRRRSERRRYSEMYGVDIKDFGNYDMIVDTSYASPEKVAFALREGLRVWKEDPETRALLVSPKRLLYPDDAPDFALAAEYSDLIVAGEDVPAVRVFESDGDLYIASGVESALAYAMAESDFIHAELVSGSPAGKTYVRMADSL